MDVVVDLNVLRGDKFKGDNYIIPLLLIIELLDSDSINYDRKMKLLEKIKNREYEIDKRHPRTFFCEAIGEKNRDQDVYDIFIENLLNSSFTNIVGFKELIEYNKLTAIKFDNSFVQHDFSKLINKDLYRGKIKENPEIETKLKLAVIKRIKKFGIIPLYTLIKKKDNLNLFSFGLSDYIYEILYFSSALFFSKLKSEIIDCHESC